MIHLRKLGLKDARGMLEWMHDSGIQQGFQADMTGRTLEDAEAFITETQYVLTDGGCMHFAVVNEKDEYMGTVSLKDISLRDKRAEYAISLRRCAQGKGIGYNATKLLLDYAFCTLHLNKVFLNVLSDNLPAIHLYLKCGFRYEGEFTDHLFLRGKYRNLKWYGIEKEDYIKKYYGEKRDSDEDHAEQT